MATTKSNNTTNSSSSVSRLMNTRINKNVSHKQMKWRIVFMIMIVLCLSWMSFSRSRITMTMVVTSIKENYDDNGIALEEQPTILVNTTTNTTASTDASTRTVIASQRQQQQQQKQKEREVETATADFPSTSVPKEEEENSTSEVAKQQGQQQNPQREEVEPELSSTTTAQEQPSLSKQEENEKAEETSTTSRSISPVDAVDEKEGKPLLQPPLSGTITISIQEEESSSFADFLSTNTTNSTIAVKTDEVKEPFYKINAQDQDDEVASSPVDALNMTPVAAAAPERKRKVSGTNTTNTTTKVIDNVERSNSSIVQVIDINRTTIAVIAQNTTSVVDSVTASEGSGKILLKTLPPTTAAAAAAAATATAKTTTTIIEEQEPAAASSSTNTTNNNTITAENVVTSDNNNQSYNQPLLNKNPKPKPKPNKKADKKNLLMQWMKNGTSVAASGNNVKVKSLLQPATSPTNDKQKAPPAVTPFRARNSTITVIKDIQNGNETFSACLLIMDDNHLLVEWLAYHYTVLPLRRLIVAVDPRSNRSPLPILQRWKGKIDYTLWNDEDYIPDVVGTLQKEGCRGDHNNKVRLSKKNETVADANGEAGFWTTVHRTRQPIFMNQCMTQLKKENRTWTLLIDTDEFLAVNNYAIETIKQSLSWIPSQSSIDHNNSSINLRQDNRSTTTAILQRIKEIQGYELALDLGESLHRMYQSGCLGVPRLPFGVRESTIKEIYNHVPSTANSSSISPISFNASNFVTHRWRHTYKQQSNGKPVIDLSRVDWKHLKKNPQNNIGVHPGIISYCGTKNRMIQIKNSYFIAHHYPGTFEQWSVRKTDARAWKKGDLTYETYLEKYDHPTNYKHADDTARGWLNDFVNDIGMDDAQKLLKGVGEVHGEHQDVLYNYSNPLAYEMCQRWHHATGSFVKDQKEMEQKVLEQEQKQMEKWKEKKQKNQQM